jgi:sortase (surface protein transpeptidase)
MAHHHHFVLIKFLLLIGVLISIFYGINYIKEKYQTYQAGKLYYQKVYKNKKTLKEQNKERNKESSVEENNANEEALKPEKGKKTQKKNKACSVYSEWEECEKK